MKNINQKTIHCNLLVRGFISMYKEDGFEINKNLDIILEDFSFKLKDYAKKRNKFTAFIKEGKNLKVVEAKELVRKFFGGLG